MTREETIRQMLRERVDRVKGIVDGYHDDGRSMSIMALLAVDVALAFADAEAAAMRERAAGVATAAAEAARPYSNGVGLGPATEKHRMLEAEGIAAAIRALPATGEVERG